MKQGKILLTQTELAEYIGISKGTLSKWIKKNNVSPIKENGNKKLYSRNVKKQYLSSKKASGNNDSRKFSTIEFLQKELDKKQEETLQLKQRINDLEKQLNAKNDQIYDLADKFATLADQAQKLNLADKQPQQLEQNKNDAPDEEVSDISKETKQETSVKKHHWWQFGR